MSKVRKRGGRPGKARKMVSTPVLPWNGDHGTGTAAATAETVVKPIEGKNPNRFARRQRVNRIEQIASRGLLSMRQAQAAYAIQEAYCKVQALSSGGELKERVQSSPKPDATVAVQVSAVSHLAHVMRPIKACDRYIVEAICWHNRPFRDLRSEKRCAVRFRAALDLVADHLSY